MPQHLGKSYRGQKFVPVATSKQVQKDREVHNKHAAKEGAISIEAWMSLRGHRDPVRRAGMLAYTPVRNAPAADFDLLFKTY